MCTFNLAIDDNLVENARVIFQNEDMMIDWLETQVSDLLSKVPNSKETTIRKPRRHNVLRGILKENPEIDYKLDHVEEKYGI